MSCSHLKQPRLPDTIFSTEISLASPDCRKDNDNDKAELEKGPGPYPKCGRVAEPYRAQFLPPLCLQINPQYP